jgi:hypothetical protein
MNRINVFSTDLTFTRVPLQRFWDNVRSSLRKGDLLRVNYIRVFFTTFEEVALFARFILSILISGIFLRKH